MGADVNAANEAGDTALHRVAAKRFNTVVQFLADNGARLEVKNKEGQTPMAIAIQGEPLPKGAFDLDSQLANAGDGRKTADLLRALGAKE
jgi:ankyrin repeat protein